LKRLKRQEAPASGVGDYRIIFAETAHAIEVFEAGHRRNIYG
jgi:mRNA-degrading endonuclease RelE of RelBE toxin-antitoxin system